jgi:hypothetical protein
MKRLLLLAVLPLAGCATMGSQPLHVACLACSTLAASGVCGTMRAVATPTCAPSEELWITNYAAFVERGAQPVIECKPRRQSDLP